MSDWRETVRDIYDRLHFKEPGFFSGDPLAKELIAFIESRHSDFFTKEDVTMTELENIEITARRRLERFREVEMMGLAGHFEVRWVPARREEEERA